jgi:voltage-gated potassium channel
MYWAVITVTTVEYGDISPHTVAGRLLASVLMMLGYGIIAVPTGIVSFELARATGSTATRRCAQCGLQHHDRDARFCKQCGASLSDSAVSD